MPRLFASILSLLAAGSAAAQSDEEKGAAGSGSTRAAAPDTDIVREVERGYYFVANVGSTIYANTHGVSRETGGLLVPVISTGIGVGSDFIDRERLSLAWQLQIQQGLYNGPRDNEVTALPAFVQGDIHTLAGVATLEVSTYLTRRLGIGVKAGGGVMLIPLLMDPQTYEQVIVAVWGERAVLHEGPLPMVVGGPTLEYYTKLSHFSVGVDVDVSYIFEFDLGISPSAFLKYTF